GLRLLRRVRETSPNALRSSDTAGLARACVARGGLPKSDRPSVALSPPLAWRPPARAVRLPAVSCAGASAQAARHLCGLPKTDWAPEKASPVHRTPDFSYRAP